jgi:hypothetical protein
LTLDYVMILFDGIKLDYPIENHVL